MGMLSPKHLPLRSPDSPEDVVFPSRREAPYQAKVLALVERGISLDENTIGFHGTGLLTLKFLLQHGFLPPSCTDRVTNGYLYFAPRRDSFSGHPHHDRFIPDEAAIAEAAGYAKLRAEQHYVLERYRLDATATRNCDVASFLASRDEDAHDREVIERAHRLVPSWNERREVAREALRHEGVVLGVARSALSVFPCTDGDFTRRGLSGPCLGTRPDLRLHVPQGLPLEYVTGIRLLGVKEREFFENLQTPPESRAA